MKKENPFVFQTDAEIVQTVYKDNPNYLIEYSGSTNHEYCSIYFCSNDIYYPNSEDIFRKRIIRENFYEWYGTRTQKSYKHIFVRDIFKQWYLAGINAVTNSPQKLLAFLQQETNGYKIETTGSSAGGYAAILYGSLLKADRVMAFNPQFELNSLLTKSNECTDPLIFRLSGTTLSEYFDLRNFIAPQTGIYFFYSNKSIWDVEQYNHIHDISTIHCIPFSTTHHGIPFLKICLPKVLNLNKETLCYLSHKKHHPLLFSIKMVGFWNTLRGLIHQLYKAYKKRR